MARMSDVRENNNANLEEKSEEEIRDDVTKRRIKASNRLKHMRNVLEKMGDPKELTEKRAVEAEFIARIKSLLEDPYTDVGDLKELQRALDLIENQIDILQERIDNYKPTKKQDEATHERYPGVDKELLNCVKVEKEKEGEERPLRSSPIDRAMLNCVKLEKQWMSLEDIRKLIQCENPRVNVEKEEMKEKIVLKDPNPNFLKNK